MVDAPSIVVVHTTPGHAMDGVASLTIPREVGAARKGIGMAETPARYCGNCGHELAPEDQFCQNCGTPVHQAATVPTPEADVPVPPPPQQVGGSAASAQQAEGTQRAWPRRHPYLTGCLGLLGLLLLLLIALVAAVAVVGGGGDGGDGGGGGSAKKDGRPAGAPAAEGASKNEPAKKDEPPAVKDTSTATLSDVRMATDGDGKHPTVVFSPKDTLYCVGNLENAPDNTKVTALWIASDVEGLKPNTKLKQISDKGGSGPFQFELSTDGTWPKGKYVVALYLNDAKEPTKALLFEVR
jgi:hypothetical protein